MMGYQYSINNFKIGLQVKVLFCTLTLFFIACVSLCSDDAIALDEPLLVDLSSHRIEIDSVFSGTSLLLFGATDREGEIIVTLRGPEKDVVVRRKKPEMGIWINRESVAFKAVPQFYSVISSKKPEKILNRDKLINYQIGAKNIYMAPIWQKTTENIDIFIQALRRVLIQEELFSESLGKVSFIDDNLFRATIDIPANVRTGEYIVEVHLISGGKVVSTKTTSLNVEKSGLSAEIWTFANNQGAYYALIAIFSSLVAGWLGSLIFRKT